jgi:hypothetical protein
MNNQSNSKYYPGDCKCKKTESTSFIVVQCQDCIRDDVPRICEKNSRDSGCSCIEVEFKHFICNTCAAYRDNIDMLNEKIDNLTYSLVYNIKHFINCTNEINEIHNISLELRQLNRKLLENLIKFPTPKNTQINDI